MENPLNLVSWLFVMCLFSLGPAFFHSFVLQIEYTVSFRLGISGDNFLFLASIRF